MLDQNTDRMWYVIGALVVGAGIILLANKAMPEIFASVTDSFEKVSNSAKGGVEEVQNSIPRPNLLDNSGGSALHNVRRYYASDVVEEDGKLALAYRNNGNIIQFYTPDKQLEKGETYTFSFYAKGSRDMVFNSFLYINHEHYISELNGNRVDGYPITTDWQRYAVTFEAVSNTDIHIHMYPDKLNADGSSDIFYLTEWKLEKGDTATPWVL